MRHAFFIGEGVEYILRHTIDSAYEASGFLHNRRARPPTFEDVYDLVRKGRYKGRMALWHASTLRVLASLTFRHGLGPVLNTQHASDIAALLSHPVIFELDVLTDADKIFFVEALLLWIYHYRLQQNKREQFTHAIIIEESHHVLSAAKEKTFGSETIMESGAILQKSGT